MFQWMILDIIFPLSIWSIHVLHTYARRLLKNLEEYATQTEYLDSCLRIASLWVIDLC